MKVVGVTGFRGLWPFNVGTTDLGGLWAGRHRFSRPRSYLRFFEVFGRFVGVKVGVANFFQ